MHKFIQFIIILFVTTNAFSDDCTPPTFIDYGNQEWIVNVYQAEYLEDIHPDNYRGRYKQKIDASGNFGVNTTLQWNVQPTKGPKDAVAFNNATGYGTKYDGCPTSGQYFTFTHKRKGFPPGKYEVYIDQWDDKTHFYLNNQLIKEMANWGSNTHALKCIYLDQNSILEIRTDNRGARQSQLQVRIVPTTVELTIDPVNVLNCPTTLNLVPTATYLKPNGNGGQTIYITDTLFNHQWTGPNINGSTTTLSPSITPNQHTAVYQLTTHYEYCTLTASSTITYNKPLPPTELEHNKWYVYGYTGTNNNNTNIEALTYYGYYRQVLDTVSNFGFKTSDQNKNGWKKNEKPSSSADWHGCQMPSNDQFTYVHKRIGFPCGTYKLKLNKWDEHSRLFINGTEVTYKTSKCTNCTAFELTAELDQNTIIEFRTKHTTNDSESELAVTPIKLNVLAGNNVQKTCPVKGNKWVHFYAHPTGEYMGSVRGTTPTSDLGNVTMTNYVDANNQIALACNSPGYMTAVMQRHWVMNPTIDGEAVVRLPYSNQEFLNLQTAAYSTQNPDDNVIYPNQTTVKLTKYSGELVDNLVNNNCDGTVNIYNSIYNNGSQNPYFYQDFQIPGFSEFWLHGSLNFSPLSTTIHSAEIICETAGKTIQVEASINDAKERLFVEKSTDGIQWSTIEVKNTSTKEKSSTLFTFLDLSDREAYYRVSTINLEDKRTIHTTLLSNCDTRSSEFSIFPNPTTSNFTIQVEVINNDNKIIKITDVSGKLMDQKSIDKETSIVSFDCSNYVKGIYFVELIGERLTTPPQRLIIK